MKVKKIADFFPFFGMLVASAVIMCIYLFAMNGRELVRILQVIVSPLVTLVIPVLNRLCGIRIPLAFNIAVAVFALFAINFASVLNFYGLIPYYDKILHTTFGIVGSFGVFILLLYGKGEKLSPWCFFILIMFCVLGTAALWEIYEYIANAIIGSLDTRDGRGRGYDRRRIFQRRIRPAVGYDLGRNRCGLRRDNLLYNHSCG